VDMALPLIAGLCVAIAIMAGFTAPVGWGSVRLSQQVAKEALS
jgi:hypothetical protein